MWGIVKEGKVFLIYGRTYKYLMFQGRILSLSSLGVKILSWEAEKVILAKFQWLKKSQSNKIIKLDFLLALLAWPALDGPEGGQPG